VRDTLLVTFDEKIDTGKLEIQEISGKVQHRFTSEKKLEIFGENSSSGLPHFPIQSEVKFRLANLSDKEGNTQELLSPTELTFFPWYDNDAITPDFAFADTLRDASNLDNWKKGGAIKNPLTSEGLLQPEVKNDNFDYKLIALKPLDTLSITLDCPRSNEFGITFYGPFSMENLERDIDSVKNAVYEGNPLFVNGGECDDKSNQVKLSKIIIEFGHHTQKIDTSKELFYVIKVYAVKNIHYGFYKLTTHLSPRLR
jgi:hypothetical protein